MRDDSETPSKVIESLEEFELSKVCLAILIAWHRSVKGSGSFSVDQERFLANAAPVACVVDWFSTLPNSYFLDVLHCLEDLC